MYVSPLSPVREELLTGLFMYPCGCFSQTKPGVCLLRCHIIIIYGLYIYDVDACIFIMPMTCASEKRMCWSSLQSKGHIRFLFSLEMRRVHWMRKSLMLLRF